MDDLLTDTVAVVTGASSGNGRQIARLFATHGADVVVADVREDPREGGTPTHEVISEESDQQAAFVECDVTDRDDIEETFNTAEEFGHVDVLVNNAAIFRQENFLEVTEAEFDQMIDVNVKGVFFGAQEAARRMTDTDGGSIVNISSVAGLRGTGNFVTYSASKGAVRLMTYALADLLGPQGIRVNAIHPGTIETAMTTDDFSIVGTEEGERRKESLPTQRFGTPKDVANAALYLASDLADYVNGESLTVDGGQSNTV